MLKVTIFVTCGRENANAMKGKFPADSVTIFEFFFYVEARRK